MVDQIRRDQEMVLTFRRENNNHKARDIAWSSALGKILLEKRIVSFETMRFSFANINGGDGGQCL